MQHYGPYLFDQ